MTTKSGDGRAVTGLTRLVRIRLHRWGWARDLNRGSNSMNSNHTAYIQIMGPKWLVPHLARWAVRNDLLASYRLPVWDSVVIEKTDQVGRWTFRVSARYRTV